jgi:hypothetical protein
VTDQTNSPRYVDALSRLVFQGYSPISEEPLDDISSLRRVGEHIATLSSSQLTDFRNLADSHHVTVRAFKVLEVLAISQDKQELATWCKRVLNAEQSRVSNALQILAPLCEELEAAQCPVAVIKSLDHWPDLGSDLDLYTSGEEGQVMEVMLGRFRATAMERSWGDRLANKWNFQIPHLSELVEIHVRYLGQTGEQTAMAARVINRRVSKSLDGHPFLVAAPEERVLISTLQRMYRHFYFRLCDMLDFAHLLRSESIDFDELRAAALVGGIWPGAATFLFLVTRYAQQYDYGVELPSAIINAAYSPDIRVHFNAGFLRVPMRPAAKLYGAQLLNAGLNGDRRAMLRLPLLPPLAVSALLAYRLTGSDKGVW